jgi:hypothetical protein
VRKRHRSSADAHETEHETRVAQQILQWQKKKGGSEEEGSMVESDKVMLER